MKTILLAGCLSVLLLSGCARRYTIRLENGLAITAFGKPQRKDGAYVYKDASGRQATVPAISVREIAPASMSKSPFIPGSAK